MKCLTSTLPSLLSTDDELSWSLISVSLHVFDTPTASLLLPPRFNSGNSPTHRWPTLYTSNIAPLASIITTLHNHWHYHKRTSSEHKQIPEVSSSKNLVHQYPLKLCKNRKFSTIFWSVLGLQWHIRPQAVPSMGRLRHIRRYTDWTLYTTHSSV